MSDENSARLIRIETLLNDFIKSNAKLGQWKEGHEKAETEFKDNVCNARGKAIKKLERFQMYLYAFFTIIIVLTTLFSNWLKIDSLFHGGN